MKITIRSVTLMVLIILFSTTIHAQVTDTIKGISDTAKVIKETDLAQDTIVKEDSEPYSPSFRKIELGIRYLPTFSSLGLRTLNENKIQSDLAMTHGFGLMVAVNISRIVGVQAEASYLAITQKYKDQDLDRQIDLEYINIPVLLSLNSNKSQVVNLNLVAGPQFGINVGSSIKTTGNNNSNFQATINSRGTDIGLAYGAGLEFALNNNHNFRCDLGYRGFYDLFDASSTKTSTNPNTYNVLISASRRTQGAYLGFTLCF